VSQAGTCSGIGDPRHRSHLPRGGRAVVCRLASLGHDVVAMVRDVQAASRRLPSGIAPRVADYEDASALRRALAGEDVAAAVAAVAAKPNKSRIIYMIMGHRALGFGEIAASYGETIVRQVRDRPCSIGKYLTWASARLDDPWPYAFSTLCPSIAEGRYSQVSKDFPAITAREPESFRDFFLRATSWSPDCVAGSPFRERHRS
jgi:hypothetical protein